MSMPSCATAEATPVTSAAVPYLTYLREQDDPMCWEAPRMFHRCAELRRFARFVETLEDHFGCRLDHDMGAGLVASAFHGDLFIEGATIRFSNFGRMIAVIEPGSLSRATRKLLAERADEHGYLLLPERFLHAPYTGRTPLVGTRMTWGGRFFGL